MAQSVDLSVYLEDAEATAALAGALVAALPEEPSGWLLPLAGELGAGKSTFARAMLRAFGHEGAVPSPTYTLVEPYMFDKFHVYHVDLYRISDAAELDFLGWSELQHGLLLVEWPERAAALMAAADIEIALGFTGDGRTASLSGRSERGSAVLATLP